MVTSADAGHFELANELMDSVRSHPGLAPIKLGMLDCGLTDAQRELLIAKDVLIVRARWEFEEGFPPEMPTAWLALWSRPFLPRYFRDFDVIVYLDSDTWVQMADGIVDLVNGAERADIAVVPEMHPSYQHLYFPQHPARKLHRHAFAQVYGQQIPAPIDGVVLNSGIFAARLDSRLWAAWAASLAEGLEMVRNALLPDGSPFFSAWHPINHLIEQNALNHVFSQRGLKLHTMSALYNFICGLSKPLFDADSRKLVEPSAPYAPIRVIHLSPDGKRATTVLDRHGHTHRHGLRWSDWREIVSGH